MKRSFPLTPRTRARILAEIAAAPDGYCVEIRPQRRSDAQSRRMWSMLDDVRDARIPWRDWQGQVLYPSSDGWKKIFLASLRKQTIVPGLEGELVVIDGGSSRELTVPEMADMQTIIEAFATERGVKLKVLEE